MTGNKKIKYFIMRFIIPGCIVIAGIVWILLQEDLNIFPGSDFTLVPYTDEHDKLVEGKSRVEEFIILSDKLVMSYTLKDGSQYPYSGISINRKGALFNVRGYDVLKIKIDTTKSKRLRIYILLYNEGITDNSDFSTNLYIYKEIPLWQNKKEYSLKVKDFYIPEWWYDINNIGATDKRIKKDFTKTIAVQIESENALPLDVTDTIELTGLSFSKDKTQFAVFTGLLLLFYYAVIIINILWRAYKRQMVARVHEVIIPYKYLKIENEQDPDTGKIIEYLMHNYQIPDLSVKTVSAACSVPAYKIPVILKAKFQLSFPGYLNSLRLNEAKRLLKATGLSITDIAMQIGYNNLSHFNNLFKFYEELSPGEYRKKGGE